MNKVNIISPKYQPNIMYTSKNTLNNNVKNGNITHRAYKIKECNDKSDNGKFDISEAMKNYLQGLIGPVSVIFKHPIMTIAAAGVMSCACALVPVTGPIMGLGFGALSVFQLAKGIINNCINFKNKDYDSAEKGFKTIGQGTIGTILSILGLKQSSIVVKEAKLMNKLNVTSLTPYQKQFIIKQTPKDSWFEAFKETISLITTKQGWETISNQLKPANIMQRGKNFTNILLGKTQEVEKLKKTKVPFKETAEGKRRAALTTEQIEKEVNDIANEVFNNLELPKSVRPACVVIKNDICNGGSYSSEKNVICINENAYKSGLFDLHNLIQHEAFHAKTFIYTNKLPIDLKEKLAKEYLIDKIKNGENEKIITKDIFYKEATMTPPKLNSKMQSEFIKLANDKLYKYEYYYRNDIAAMVRPIIEANPDFLAEYSSLDEAVNVLTDYAMSHNYRYNVINEMLIHPKGNVNTSLLKSDMSNQADLLIKWFKNKIECVEANGVVSLNPGSGSDFNQYQFCNEEVLAEHYGNSYAIKVFKHRLEKLRKNQNFDKAEEARLIDMIERFKLSSAYKIKGNNYYRVHVASLNNPKDKDLLNQALNLKSEIKNIKIKMKDILNLEDFKQNKEVLVNNYTTEIVKERIKPSGSIYIPLSGTEASDILSTKDYKD